MESSPQPPVGAEDDAPITESTGSKRRKVSVAINQTLQAWVQRRSLPENESPFSEETVESTDDDGETSETKEKTSKFRSLFKAFFGKQVEKATIPDTEPPKDATEASQASSEAPVTSELTPIASAEETTAEQPEIIQPIEAEPAGEAVQPGLEAETTPEVTPEPEQNVTAQESPLDPVVAAEYERQARAEAQATESETPPEAQSAEPAEVEVPLQNERTTSAATGEGAADASSDSSERRYFIPKHMASETEVRRIEKRERRHNRQRKHQEKELAEKTHKLEKAQKSQQKELEKIAAAPVKVVETTSKIPEQAPQPPQPEKVKKLEKAEAVPRKETEVKEVKAAERPPESLKEILAKRQQERLLVTPEKPESLARANYETMRPETVLQQVEKAAEEDVAIEGLFELRHEVKDTDDAFTQASSTGATITGVRQAGSHASYDPPAPTPSVSAPQAVTVRKEHIDPIIRDEYTKAARNGFLAAVVVLIFIALMVFVR